MKNVIAILLLLVASHCVHACSCIGPDVPIEEYVAALYDSADVVGVFEAVGQSFGTRRLQNDAESGRWIELEPHRLFKGSREVLFAYAGSVFLGTSCDMPYRKGALFLIYASSNSLTRLSGCASSGPLTSRFEHLPVLFGLSEAWR